MNLACSSCPETPLKIMKNESSSSMTLTNTKNTNNIKNLDTAAEDESDGIRINSISCMYLIINLNY